MPVYIARPPLVGAPSNRCDQECPFFLPPQNPSDRQSVLYRSSLGRNRALFRVPGSLADIKRGHPCIALEEADTSSLLFPSWNEGEIRSRLSPVRGSLSKPHGEAVRENSPGFFYFLEVSRMNYMVCKSAVSSTQTSGVYNQAAQLLVTAVARQRTALVFTLQLHSHALKTGCYCTVHYRKTAHGH